MRRVAAPLSSRLWRGAEGGGEPGSEIPPPGKCRRQDRACVVHAERKQPVPDSARESAFEPRGVVCIQSNAVPGLDQHKGAVGG